MSSQPYSFVVPAREIRSPAFLSPGAQAVLQYASLGELPAYPRIDDRVAWHRLVRAADQAMQPMLQQLAGTANVQAQVRMVGSVPVYDILPQDVGNDDPTVVLDLHGGGLIYCGGPLCEMLGRGVATRLQRRVWAVDYRMPPDHPYPASLEDGMTVYRALLEERPAHRIVVHGASAGGNLAAALVLMIRDQGLPLPAAVVLATPEIDLTESGDSFQTNSGIDRLLASLMPVNLLYANGHDLGHPYLSPLFGDFRKGFPPTVLTTGTRDLFLSNTVRMHRALRAANVEAELHVTEAGGHGGFPAGTPEGDAIDADVRRFIERHLATTRG